MIVNISTREFYLIWRNVWKSLPQQVRGELATSIGLVEETPSHRDSSFVYGCYSPAGPRTGNIQLYTKDLSHLSGCAIAGVMAHELGHAYCHLKRGDPAPCRPEIDTGANCMASAWGFQQELQALEEERKPAIDS